MLPAPEDRWPWLPCPGPSCHSDHWIFLDFLPQTVPDPLSGLSCRHPCSGSHSCPLWSSPVHPKPCLSAQKVAGKERGAQGPGLLLGLRLAAGFASDLHQLLPVPLLGLGPVGTKHGHCIASSSAAHGALKHLQVPHKSVAGLRKATISASLAGWPSKFLLEKVKPPKPFLYIKVGQIEVLHI